MKKKTHIIVGVDGRVSMKAVAREMDENAILYIRGFKNWLRYESITGKQLEHGSPEFRKGDVVIRWGNRIDLRNYGPINDTISYNQPMYVWQSSNKAVARRILNNANVPVPNPVSDLDNCKYPVVVRPLQHKGGKRLYVCENHLEAKRWINKLGGWEKCYVAEVYPKTREFRLHVAHGKVLFIKEKPQPDNIHRVAWNHAVNHDEWASVDRKDFNPEMCKISLEAMESLGLDFGAVDLMSYPLDKKLPKHVICEINTAPTLTPYGAMKWGMYFDWLSRSNGSKRNHWEFWKYDTGISFAWKNFQLNDQKA